MKRFFPFAILAAVAAVALYAATGGAPFRSLLPGATPPAVIGQVPPFQLVSDTGAPFDSASLAGRSWLASFLFTSCPGPCPRLVERLKELRLRIPAASMAMVSFSVDPATDTPEVLTDYKKARNIVQGDAWTFVTGPPDKVLDVVQKGFRTGVEASTRPEDEGAVTHGVRVVLVDGQQRIRGFYSTEDDEDLRRLERDVAALDASTN